ncbi:MAG TPA: metalloprotease, partial [Massilia timonae]|nr:metalloprotease [Massilia timonae]
MRWEGDRESDNVEDRRGDGGGGGGGFGFGGRSIGIGTIVVAVVASYFLGVSPATILGLLSGGAPPQQQAQVEQPRAERADDRETRFVRTTLAYTEDAWAQLFSEQGAQYTP